MSNPVIVPEPGDRSSTDFRLEGDFCWIAVGNLSVYIDRTSPGELVIEVFPKDQDNGDVIAELSVPYPEED